MKKQTKKQVLTNTLLNQKLTCLSICVSVALMLICNKCEELELSVSLLNALKQKKSDLFKLNAVTL